MGETIKVTDLDVPALIPFAPPPGCSDHPEGDTGGGEVDGQLATTAFGPQTPGPVSDLFVRALQQLLVPAHTAPAAAVAGTAALSIAFAERAQGYTDLAATEFARQTFSAPGKLLPPAALQAAVSGRSTASSGSPIVEDLSQENGLAATIQAIESVLDGRLAACEARLSLEGQRVSLRSTDDSPLATRHAPSLAALPSVAIATDIPDALSSGVGAIPADSPDVAPAISSSHAAMSTIALLPSSLGWNEALGERVLWLVGNRVSAAQLSLNPPDLGPLEVRIVYDGKDKVQVHFASAHQTVRESLEHALPRLREMFGDAGLQLLGADVRHDWGGAAGSRGGGEPKAFLGLFDIVGEGKGARSAGSLQTAIRLQEGLVDLFA